MKKLYFMKKAEAMEEEQYENRDKRVTYHYRRPEQARLYNETRATDESCPPRKTTKQRMIQSRKSVYIIQILIILGIVGYYGWMNKDSIMTKLGLNKQPVEYFIRTITYPETNEIEILVNLKNKSKKTGLFRQSFQLQYFINKGGKKYQKGETHKSIHNELEANEALGLGSLKFKDSNPRTIESIEVVINDEITIHKGYQFRKKK